MKTDLAQHLLRNLCRPTPGLARIAGLMCASAFAAACAVPFRPAAHQLHRLSWIASTKQCISIAASSHSPEALPVSEHPAPQKQTPRRYRQLPGVDESTIRTALTHTGLSASTLDCVVSVAMAGGITQDTSLLADRVRLLQSVFDPIAGSRTAERIIAKFPGVLRATQLEEKCHEMLGTFPADVAVRLLLLSPSLLLTSRTACQNYNVLTQHLGASAVRKSFLVGAWRVLNIPNLASRIIKAKAALVDIGFSKHKAERVLALGIGLLAVTDSHKRIATRLEALGASVPWSRQQLLTAVVRHPKLLLFGPARIGSCAEQLCAGMAPLPPDEVLHMLSAQPSLLGMRPAHVLSKWRLLTEAAKLREPWKRDMAGFTIATRARLLICSVQRLWRLYAVAQLCEGGNGDGNGKQLLSLHAVCCRKTDEELEELVPGYHKWLEQNPCPSTPLVDSPGGQVSGWSAPK